MENLIGKPVFCTQGNQEAFVSLHAKRLDAESTLDDLIVSCPSLLPIELINDDFADPVLVIKQFGIDGNWVDVLLVNREGRITIVESKLQKNPESKRKVFGQILDYATSIHNLDYETFSTKCGEYSKNIETPRDSNDPLGSIMEEFCDGFDAADFRKKVANGLELGRFLLIILGDKVHDDLTEMVQFLTDHSQLGFEIAAVEFMHFESKNQKHKLVVPRVVEVYGREFIRWEPDQKSVAAQELNKASKTTAGRKRQKLSEVEAIATFRSGVLELAEGEQALKLIEQLADECLKAEILMEYKSSGYSRIAYCYPPKWEGDERFNLFQCNKTGLLDTYFLQYMCDKTSLPESIWINHWTKLGKITGAGTLVKKPTPNVPNQYKFLDANEKTPAIIDVLGINGEHIEAISKLIVSTANAIIEASEALKKS